MERTVNFELFDKYLTNNTLADLETESYVSVHTIMKIRNRRNPRVPGRISTLRGLADAIGVDVDTLFPLVQKSVGGATG